MAARLLIGGALKMPALKTLAQLTPDSTLGAESSRVIPINELQDIIIARRGNSRQ